MIQGKKSASGTPGLAESHERGKATLPHVAAAGFRRRDLGGHSLERGALTTGMEAGIHPAKLKHLGRHKSFDVLGEYLEVGDLFDCHPLSGVL
jgi:hypothetical protein